MHATPLTIRRRHLMRDVRRRGVALMVVLVAVAVATVLGMSFLAAQTTTTGITRNLEDKAVARQLAESGMAIIKHQILTDADWRTGRANGLWIDSQRLGEGSFSVEIQDADGDPSGKPDDPFTLIVTGRYRTASHVARYEVQPFASGDEAGLTVKYIASQKELTKLDDVDWNATPAKVARVEQVNRTKENGDAPGWAGGPKDYWASLYQGYIDIPQTGLWTFYTESDDGSALYIDGKQIVNNDGKHAWQSASGSVSLDKGRHAFEVRFFEWQIDQGVVAHWQGPGVSKAVIPASAFFSTAGSQSGSGDAKDDDEKVGASAIPVAVADRIQLWGNSKIDAYVSSKGAYGSSNKSSAAVVSTNGTASQVVQMSDNANIQGKLLIGPGGNGNTVVNWGNSKITGGIDKLEKAVTMPTTAMPSGAPSSSGNLGVWSGSQTLSSNARYSGIGIGNAATVTVQGNITLWCEGSFQLSGSAKFVIPEGSSVKLHVTGSVGIYGSSRMNPATDAPDRLQIIMVGSNGLQISDSAQCSGHITNPGGALSIYGSSQLFGRFIGKTLTMSDSASLHMDGAGEKESPEEAPPQEPAITYLFRWNESL